MPKMASDFLHSNLFNPTAPSEQILERARRRRIKGGNRDLQETTSGGPSAIQVSRSPERSSYVHCKNNNSYAFQNCNTYGNYPGKKSKSGSPQLTQSMLKSMLSEGLVELPGPPVHPRPKFDNEAVASATHPRRDRVKNICSQNSHQNLSIFSGTREILTGDNQLQNMYNQAHSLGQLFPKETNINLMNDAGVCTDGKSKDVSRENYEFNEQNTDLTDGSSRISPGETVEKIGIQEPQEEIPPETSVPQQNEPFSADTKSEFFCNSLNLNDTKKVKSNVPGSNSNQRKNEAIALNDAFNLLQMKTELDKLNHINKHSVDNASKHCGSHDKNLFRESLQSGSTFLLQSSEIKIVEIRVTDQFSSSDEVAKVEIKPTNLDKKSKGSRKVSSKRKQLLRLLHIFLGIRWMKTTQKEDQKSLVEEEMTELDGIKLELTSKRTKKKLRGNKQSSGEQKNKNQQNQESGQVKDLTTTESAVKKKKRRRPRKKNLIRCGRQLKKNLTKECRSIARDLISISYMLPESYTCPRRFGGIPCPDYTTNDRINPNAPAWDGDKRYPVYDYC